MAIKLLFVFYSLHFLLLSNYILFHAHNTEILTRPKILEQSSLLHETGAAITVAPNASLILQSWDFSPAKSKLVALSKANIWDGLAMKVVVDGYYANTEEKYGIPLYAAHRVDLHSQLREIATKKDGEGIPVDLVVKAKTVGYVSISGYVLYFGLKF